MYLASRLDPHAPCALCLVNYGTPMKRRNPSAFVYRQKSFMCRLELPSFLGMPTLDT